MGLLACIRDNIFSTVAGKLLDEEGIARNHIHRIPGINTAVSFVHLIPSGANWIVGHLGANLHMRTEHVNAAEDQIASSNIVIAQYEVPALVVRRVLELGRKHGRLMIPPMLREYAGLGRDVVWAGMVKTIELWSKEAWNAQAEASRADRTAISQALAELGL